MSGNMISGDPAQRLADATQSQPGHDGVDRRGFLKCMAWAGTGLVWTLSAGVLSSRILTAEAAELAAPAGDFTFAQLSDSHIGFAKDPNHDVTSTLQQAVARVNALKTRPAFIIHTGDISHLSTPEQFDTAQQVLKGAKSREGELFVIPGEHDTFVDNGKEFLKRYRKPGDANGWQSFDYKGVHFVALINVWNLKGGGFGTIGRDQLDWLKQDLQGLSADTPVVVYAHVPLWAIYPQWGWGTDDAQEALSLLRRFASVTVLNGHIHQILQKTEGNITFHTAASTAYPQPAPGGAPSPGPYRVRTDQLLSSLGVREVSYVHKQSQLVVVDRRVG